MIYLEHFGLQEAPFSLTPDTGYFCGTAGHLEALEVLQVALQSGEGFIKIIGEVGTGKTLLCRKLLGRLDAMEGDWVSAYLPNPLLGPVEIYRAIADELGLKVPSHATAHTLLKDLSAHLVALAAEGQRLVLCIDEAQVMSDKSLEALRLLSNLETEKTKLLHIVLFAQPELDARLSQPGLRQLRQRLAFNYHLPPLSADAMARYVEHRLQVAGCPEPDLFTPAALKALERGSGGIPRMVNILCHKAMMAAYGQGEQRIELRHLKAAISDTDDARRNTALPQKAWPWAGGLLAGAAALVFYLAARGGMP